MLYSTIVQTPVGDLGLVYRDEAVVYCRAARSVAQFERAAARALGQRPVPRTSLPPTIDAALQAYWAGERPFAAVDLSALPPFQQRVLAKAGTIPRGATRSYAWIARELGEPNAAQDVGIALAENPILVLIPCHRVIHTDGRLGGYADGGPARKRALLTLEGALLVA